MYIDTTFPCLHIYYIFFLYFSNFAISFCILHVIGRIFIEWERRQFSFFILLCCVDVLYIPSFSAKSLSLSLSLGSLLLLLQRPTKVQRFEKIIQYALGNIYISKYIFIDPSYYSFFPPTGRISTTPSFNNK